MGRFLTCLAVAGCLGLAGMSLAGAASAATETIDASVDIVTRSIPRPNDPNRCVAIAFVRFADVEDATSWTLRYRDRGRRHTRAIRPPFQDRFRMARDIVVDVPRRRHQVALSWVSTGRGCGASAGPLIGRFTDATVRVTVKGAFIQGRVVDDEGAPMPGVTIRARGPASLSGSTVSDGTYSIKVPARRTGGYTVRASNRGGIFRPARREVTVRRGSTARASFRLAGCARKARASAVHRYQSPTGPSGTLRGTWDDCNHDFTLTWDAILSCSELIGGLPSTPIRTQFSFAGKSSRGGALPVSFAPGRIVDGVDLNAATLTSGSVNRQRMRVAVDASGSSSSKQCIAGGEATLSP